MAAKPTKAEHADACRRLIRRQRRALLSTAMSGKDGWPYGSLAAVAFDTDLSPLMLFSDLSDHTRNLARDGRASLLFEETAGRRNPQTGPRVTVLGRIAETKAPGHRRRFLARHPDARLYAGFADFNVYRMEIERLHFVGGFAQAIWLKAMDVVPDARAAKALAEAEESVIRHMNEDHAGAIDHYANALLGRRGRGWKMTGIDPDGVDLQLGGRFARLAFDAPLANRKAIRAELVRLASEKGSGGGAKKTL